MVPLTQAVNKLNEAAELIQTRGTSAPVYVIRHLIVQAVDLINAGITALPHAGKPVFGELSIRAEVWLRAWNSVALSDGGYRNDVATAWADECLKAFDERFPGYGAGKE